MKGIVKYFCEDVILVINKKVHIINLKLIFNFLHIADIHKMLLLSITKIECEGIELKLHID